MKWNAQARLILFVLVFLGFFVFVNYGLNTHTVANAVAWEPVETWVFNVTGTGGWRNVENWTVFVNKWTPVETWVLNGRGFARGFSWPAHTAFNLTLWNTCVSFEDTVYMDAWEFFPLGPALPSWAVVFYNVSMGYGEPIPILTVETINANLSFTAIDYLHEVSWNVSTTSALAAWDCEIGGMDDANETFQPEQVIINGTEYSEGTYWSISEAMHLFVANYTVKSTSEVRVQLLWAGGPSAWYAAETWILWPFTGSSPDLGGTAFYLPLMSIFGLIGLVAMFGGPLYGIHKFRKHEYFGGAIIALLIFVIGFSLFIAWLWSALI